MNSSDLPTADKAHVQLESVVKNYETRAGDIPVLLGVDLEVRPGEAVAIMGRSGCGKTTLLNLMGGIDHPSSGRVLYNGNDLGALSERELEDYRLNRVGFVFQLFNLIPSLTALENVNLPMILAEVEQEERNRRAMHLLELVEMDGKAHKFPDELSGGEQQRIAISVALANNAPLILADEPTGNLDSKSSEMVTKWLCSLAKDYGKTVLIVSHDPHIPPRVDRSLVMEDGKFEAGAFSLKEVSS
jgi:putative ABC transport system ATP-binding protein